MTKEQPIIFSAEMVRAILDGRKTQTRRVIKDMPPRPPRPVSAYFDAYNGGPHWNWWASDNKCCLPQIKCPYGQAGDRLWVREGFGYSVRNMGGTPHQSLVYRATEPDAVSCYDCNGNGLRMRWQSPIYMPRWASRITLEIKAIRVERLQDISATDAIAEGVKEYPGKQGYYFDYLEELAPFGVWHKSPVKSFASLIDSIKGPGTWAANPWVWVVEFEVVK